MKVLRSVLFVLFAAATDALLSLTPPDAEGAQQIPVADVNQGAQIAPFGKEDTAQELQSHAAKTQDTLIDAIENAEVAEIKRAVFRALTRLRAAQIKEFDTIARLETQAIDAYNDAHHYRNENPLDYLHSSESAVAADKYTPSTVEFGWRADLSYLRRSHCV